MQKYEIMGIIGEGAYGVVLKCRSNESQEVVAIKKFKESEEDEAVRKTTAREVKVLKMLRHPNVVELREAFRKKGVVYLVFEFVQSNLLEVLERCPGGLDPELIRAFLYQLLKGLAHMHAHHLLHRDIKPENLLVSDQRQLKICDFGFARQAPRADEELTDYVATRWYRPPELLVGTPYGKEVDLWAAGCIMAELVDGNPLFPGENELDQLYLIQKTLGKLTPTHDEAFRKNPRFLGMRFPEIHNLDTLEKKYLGKLSPKALNFLKQLLRMAPADRLSAAEALRHPYFDGLREDDLLRKPSSNSHLRHESKNSSVTPAGREREDEHRRRASNMPYQNPSEPSNGGEFNRSTKANITRKGREEIVRMVNTKGFQQQNYSKSVNKPNKQY
jgi:cyclin-dependent kinase-like